MVNVTLDQKKIFQLKIKTMDSRELPLDNPVKHITTNIDGIKKLFPRDTDLFILKACASRMEVNAYIFYRPEHLKFEVEVRRIR